MGWKWYLQLEGLFGFWVAILTEVEVDVVLAKGFRNKSRGKMVRRHHSITFDLLVDSRLKHIPAVGEGFLKDFLSANHKGSTFRAEFGSKC